MLFFQSMENDEAPGNLGLRDQALAFDWIKKESNNFCGNPDKITIFGSGSGGSSALLQMITPINYGKNLFRSIISQSGNIINVQSLHNLNRRELALKFAESMGCKYKTVSNLIASSQRIRIQFRDAEKRT